MLVLSDSFVVRKMWNVKCELRFVFAFFFVIIKCLNGFYFWNNVYSYIIIHLCVEFYSFSIFSVFNIFSNCCLISKLFVYRFIFHSSASCLFFWCWCSKCIYQFAWKTTHSWLFSMQKFAFFCSVSLFFCSIQPASLIMDHSDGVQTFIYIYFILFFYVCVVYYTLFNHRDMCLSVLSMNH